RGDRWPRAGRCTGWRGHGPAGVPAQRVQAGVGGDPVQPGTWARLAPEAFPGAPGTQEHLLHVIFGLLEGPEHPVAVHVQLTPVLADQVVEVPGPGPVSRGGAVRAGGRDASGFLATSSGTHSCTPPRPRRPVDHSTRARPPAGLPAHAPM